VRVRELLDRARQQAVRGKPLEALALAEEAVSLAPDDARALRVRDELRERARTQQLAERPPSPREATTPPDEVTAPAERLPPSEPATVAERKARMPLLPAIGRRRLTIVAALMLALVGVAVGTWRWLAQGPDTSELREDPSRSRDQAIAAEKEMAQAKRQAEQEQARQLADRGFAQGAAKEREGVAALGRPDYPRAGQLFREAREEHERAA
jgi:hypothetical protein